MKNKFIKLSSIILVVACGVLASCNGNSQDDLDPNGTKYVDIKTTHINNSKETSKYVFQNKNFNYSLVIPANATDNEKKAASAIVRLANEATGKTISLLTEENDISGKNIFIGDTDTAENNNVEYTYDSNSGFIIKTVDENIYLLGGEVGIVYSAYELMTHMFNFEYFGEYDYEIDKDVTEVKLYNYDIVELPDFEYRSSFVSGEARTSKDSMYRDCMRIESTSSVGKDWNGTHNAFNYIPYYSTDAEAQAALGDLYTTNYREWFANVKDPYNPSLPCNLCYSRHFDEIYAVALKSMKETIEYFPQYSIFNFSNNDNLLVCECDECKKQPCDSYNYVRLLNKLAKDCSKWAKETYDRDINIMGLAYYGFENAPAKKVTDETGTHYVPYDDSVKFDEHLIMQFAIHTTDYQIPFNATGNEKDYNNLLGWSALCDKLFVWTYSQADFADYLMFYDNFSSLQQNTQLLVQNHGCEILEMGQYDQEEATGFNNLRAYITYKLEWNSKLVYHDLLDRYFTHAFGPAAETMRNLFDTLINRYTDLHHQELMNQNIYSYGQNRTFFPQGFVNSLLRLIDKAYGDIIGSENYETYKRAILLESMWIRIVQVNLYGTTFNEDDLLSTKLAIKEDANKLGMTKRGESRSIDLLWEEWGIK